MIRSRFSVIAFIALFVALGAGAQDKQAPVEKSLLWRITKKDMPQPCYLFGTMDFICPADYLWTPAMADCFSKADKVCLDLDLDDSLVKKQAMQAIMGVGKKTTDYFSSADFDKVNQYLKDTFRIDIKNLGVLKPIAIQPMIVKRLLGCQDAISYNVRMVKEAHENKKEVIGIESVADEMQDIDLTHFNDKIVKTLSDMAGGSTYYYEYRSQLMAAYHNQDIQKENDLARSNPLLGPAEQKILLDDKNKRWVSRMPKVMKQGSIFFATNSINFWGDEGMITLLRKAGYSVEPVK